MIWDSHGLQGSVLLTPGLITLEGGVPLSPGCPFVNRQL